MKPEPIPILRGKDALEFKKRLKNPKIDPSAKELYRDALKDYKARQKMNDDIRIRKVGVLGDRAKAEALKQGCKENDLVIVKTIITREHPLPRYEITKIEGSPTQFLYDRMLKNKTKGEVSK